MRKLIYMEGEPGTGKSSAAETLHDILAVEDPERGVEVVHDLIGAHAAFELGAEVVILDPEGKPFEVEVRYFNGEETPGNFYGFGDSESV